MVELGYQLSHSFTNGLTGDDLATADEASLRYRAIFGDIGFRANAADFGTRWGWVPVLDFALALQAKLARNPALAPHLAGDVESRRSN